MNTDRDKEEVLMQAEIYVENGFIDRRTYRQTHRQTQRYTYWLSSTYTDT